MPRIWAQCFGYGLDKNDQCQFIVNHQGEYCIWSLDDLYQSNLQLPEKNPRVPGDLKNFRFGFFKIPIKKDREVNQNGVICVKKAHVAPAI